jgi:hypothetical protein
VDFGEVILIVEEHGEIAGKADESAEGNAVEETEPPRVGFPQDGGVVFPLLGDTCAGGVLRH